VTTSHSPHRAMSSRSSCLMGDPEGDLESEAIGSVVLMVLDSPELQDRERGGALGASL
jgi:hypothetical protein